ncbi:MAG TPA: GNAT family N-acetyltransferase [Bryobacteraceae bacterium]|nr:GNAT family N-acetyltransferase [Bryobacteraceae bacterium]
MYNAVEGNLRAAMRCYSNIGGDGEARDYPAVTVASTGLDVSVFNSAMLPGPADSIDSAIAQAEVHFRARRLGWTFWVCEDLLSHSGRANLHAAFTTRRMTWIASPPGMFAQRLLPPVRPAASMTFDRVGNERTRLEFAHIASVVFSLAFTTAKQIYGSSRLWRPPSHGWIGYFEGKPVSIVTVVIAEGAAGVYSLGTLPQHQGCGFGETLLRHALEEARKEFGIERTVLQATPQGSHLYLRMGYRIVTKFSIFMREGSAL